MNTSNNAMHGSTIINASSIGRRFGLAAVAAALALGSTASTYAVEPGQPAPALNLETTDTPLSPERLHGKLSYVDFWASWCGPCKQSFPWMREMQSKYGARGFQVIAISVDAKRSDADAFLAQRPVNFTIAFDAAGASPKSFGVKGMPTSVLIGPDGTVLATHVGFREEDRQALEARIEAALPAPTKGP